MSKEQFLEVAALARAPERTMGWPVDLEAAYRDDARYLLRCRPVTPLGTLAGGAQSAGHSTNGARADGGIGLIFVVVVAAAAGLSTALGLRLPSCRKIALS